MTMRRTNDFVVGLVIILGAAVIVGATLWARQADVGRRRAEVTARFRDVSGTQVGNAVLIRGVRAGRVRQVELADDGWVQVRLTLDPAVQLPSWRAAVRAAAAQYWPFQDAPLAQEISVSITYFFEGAPADVDNVIKPILDAIKGLAYQDDIQITDLVSRRRPLEGPYRVESVSAVLAAGIALNREFLHVRVASPPEGGELSFL